MSTTYSDAKEQTASAVSSLSEPVCTCGCTRSQHMGKPKGCQPHGFHEFEAGSPAPVPLSEAPLYDVAKKAHEEKQAAFQAVQERAAKECPPGVHSMFDPCPGDCANLIPDEPPLTPEEEEQAECPCVLRSPEDYDGPMRDCPIHGDLDIQPAPPQPVRRPPYAVAYSVDGHLYEVALPGDATVTAVDGALVIKHGAGQVAGIVGIQPIDTKEAS